MLPMRHRQSWFSFDLLQKLCVLMVFMPPCVISMEGESAVDADFFTEGRSSGESVALRLREVYVDSVSAPF